MLAETMAPPPEHVAGWDPLLHLAEHPAGQPDHAMRHVASYHLRSHLTLFAGMVEQLPNWQAPFPWVHDVHGLAEKVVEMGGEVHHP